ncbi:unnamed protein product [Schistosoma margrebowiei]|uniref:Uncharacterized protein n=1 Tax=Schistosoma margrebowiei TaxID=48269 RepID=A0A183LGY6_9TREM|nr:unnamed protein product [Schistosoma margrebowiei]
MQPDDLNFTHHQHLSHTHQHMQINTTSVAVVSTLVRLKIHQKKGNILKYNTENSKSITLDGETVEQVESLTYLDSMINGQEGYDVDVNVRIDIATTISTVEQHMKFIVTIRTTR